MPKGLTLEEQDIYLVKIEETAAPIEDEAVKRFEFAYQRPDNSSFKPMDSSYS